MRRDIVPNTLIFLIGFLGGCSGDQPLEPTLDESFSAAVGSGLKAPSDLMAAPSASAIRLTWKDNSSGESGFEVLRSTSGLAGQFSVYVPAISAGAVVYEDFGVEPSTTYCYQIRAFKTSGRNRTYSALSTSACAMTPLPVGAPAAPTGTTAVSANSSTITVSWADNSADGDGFLVERAASATGSWEPAATGAPGLISISDAGRKNETQACYRVAAFNANGRSPWSAEACAIPPAAPTNLSAAATDQSTIDLTWIDNSGFEDGYELQRAMADGGPYFLVASLPANVTNYRDAGLTSDQAFWYRVRAKRAGGFSDHTGPIAGVAATTAPVAPTWVSASPFNGSGAFLSWADNSINEAGFRLERSDGGGPWVTLTTFGAGESQTLHMWDYEQYPQEAEICYRLVAFNSLGEAAGAGCTAIPAVPIDLKASVVDGVVELSWTDNSRFEDGYYIVRADGISMGFYYVYGAVGPNVTTFRDLSPDPDWASYYLRAMKGPEGYSCCSNAVDVYTPTAPGP